jgi:hypothetical protein
MNWASLRVGLVGPLPPPAGGMANQTLQLANLLRSEDASVVLVRTNAPYSPAWIGALRDIRAFFRLIPYLFRPWQAAGCVDLFHVMANSGWSWHHASSSPRRENRFARTSAISSAKRSVCPSRTSLAAAMSDSRPTRPTQVGCY